MIYDAIIVGAGPVGLSLALALARARRSVLVLEKEAGTSEHSRAPAIWPRTQEIFARLGVIRRFLDEGIVLRELTIWDTDRDRVLLHLPLTELEGQTPFPQLLILPQSQTERLLYEALCQEPEAEVLFSAEVTDFTQHPATVTATYRHGSGCEIAEGAFVIGCDGAHSTVRDRLGASLEGMTYGIQAALADVILARHQDYRFPRLTNRDGLAIAIRMDDRIWRLILPFSPQGDVLPLEARISRAVAQLFSGQDHTTVWKSAFHLHRRISNRLLDRRVTLAGDAAHLNSPVGGQGMNAGIQDTEVLAEALLEGLSTGEAGALERYAKRRHVTITRGVNRFTDLMTRALLVGGGRFLKPVMQVVGLALHVTPLRRRILRRLAMLDQ